MNQYLNSSGTLLKITLYIVQRAIITVDRDKSYSLSKVFLQLLFAGILSIMSSREERSSSNFGRIIYEWTHSAA